MRSIQNKVNDVIEIINPIMKVDHEVDTQWGAAHSYCEKMTGVFLFSPLPHFCTLVH